MNAHRCHNADCTYCEAEAERRRDAIEPDYDLDHAADQYERSLGL